MSRILLFVTVLLVTISAGAEEPQSAGPGPADVAPFGPQANISPLQQQLKFEAVEAQAEARSLLDRVATPLDTRSNFYVGQRASALRLQNIRFSIDGGAPFVLAFSAREASAMAETSGMRRVGRINLQPGLHEIHAEFEYSGGASGGPSDQTAGHSSLDLKVDKTPGEINLKFSLVSAALGSSTPIEGKQVHADDTRYGWLSRTLNRMQGGTIYATGSDDDPAIAYASYLGQTDGPEAALVERLRVGRDAPHPDVLPDEYWLGTGAAYRAVGILEHDREICDRLAGSGADKVAVATERLHLGEAYFERGDLQQADLQFKAAKVDLPEYLEPDWRLSYALLLFSQKRTAEVVKLLKQTTSDSVEAFRYMSEMTGTLRAAAYRRYNLAVAMVAAHVDEQRGLSWLDLVGRVRTRDEDLLGLRDKANVTLGWHFLNAKEGKTAIGVLGRVRTVGLFSNSALLGIGWSQLAPGGSKQPRKALEDESAVHPDPFLLLPPIMKNSLTQLRVLEPEQNGSTGPRSFSHKDPPLDPNEGLRRAIEFWKPLADRDIHDPSVQEGQLAIAYAYDQLDDRAQGREAYTRAIGTLEGVKNELEESATSVRQGDLAAAIAQADDDPSLFLVMDRFRLAPGEPRRELYATVDRSRSFRTSEQALKVLDDRLSAVDDSSSETGAAALLARIRFLEAGLAAEQSEAGHHINELATSDLDGRQRTLEKYMQAAYFSMARLNDRVAH